MNKITGAIYEIHHMDELADRDQWVNRVHPLVKFLITLFYIISVVSNKRLNLAGSLVMGVYPIILFMVSELSVKVSFMRIRLIVPVICVIGVVNIFTDTTELYVIGTFAVTTGMVSMMTLICKGINTVLASYLFIATTSIEKICYALRLLHIPKILVTQVLLSYRYISVLLQEVNKSVQAYALRAPHQKGIQYRVWGSMVGQLLLRSIDRAGVVYESMVLRGFTGEFYHGKTKSCSYRDYGYLMSWTVIISALRLIWR